MRAGRQAGRAGRRRRHPRPRRLKSLLRRLPAWDIAARPPARPQVERTWRAGESVELANVEKRDTQFTYADGDECVFMVRAGALWAPWGQLGAFWCTCKRSSHLCWP